MADLSDVENALKSLIVGWAYPNGTSQPSALPGAVAVGVERGWPTSGALTAALKAKMAQVSIYSAPGSERQTTRYPRQWETLTPAAPTLAVSLSGATITLSGTVSAPQLVAVLAYGQVLVYPVQAGDTLATIASGLVALIAPLGSVSSSGATLTVPSPKLGVSVGAFGTVWRELRRQERLIQVTIWCATPEQRDVVASFIDARFAGWGSDTGLEFINLADGSQARLQYARTAPTDQDQLSGAFRRDLIYSVEYPTIETRSVPQVTVFETVYDLPGGVELVFDELAELSTGGAVIVPGTLDFTDPNQSDLIPAVF